MLLALGVGLDENPSQREALFNTHHLQNSGVDIDDRHRRHDGQQMLCADDVTFDLEYVRASTMLMRNRMPSEEEIKSCHCVLLLDSSKIVDDEDVVVNRRRVGCIDFGKVFGHLSKESVQNTIFATTQLATTPLEAESRVIPRQRHNLRGC